MPSGASRAAVVIKNPPARVGDTRDGVRSWGQADPLEEEMAAHSRILAWEVPWTEEPGGREELNTTEPWSTAHGPSSDKSHSW